MLIPNVNANVGVVDSKKRQLPETIKICLLHVC